jgi:thymidylate synthase (FAD)
MNVVLTTHTPHPDFAIAMGASICYSETLKREVSKEYMEKILRRLYISGHSSVFEHASFTFAIEGVSRALTHQLVRHRIGFSYSQQSQRYVKEANAEYITPHNMTAEQHAKYQRRMKMIHEWYLEAIEEGVTPEDARYYLPNAWETKIIVTANARALLNFLEERLCNKAQWEIRELAEKMLIELRKVAPITFEIAGQRCVNGKCLEVTPCRGVK